MVPGPHTSWVIRTSTSTQMLSPGRTASRPVWRASTFSVRVIGGICERLPLGVTRRGRDFIIAPEGVGGTGTNKRGGGRMGTPRTCRLLTLGCKVNQYETQYVKELLQANGYAEAEEGRPADLCVVNTCTVTAEGDAKGRQLVRRLHQANPGAAIVVMGCYATRDPDTVRRLPGVTHVITDKERLADELAPFGVVARPAGISRFDSHQRAFVKVQDGCLLNCSYCII